MRAGPGRDSEGAGRQTANYRLSIPRSVNARTQRLPTEVYQRIDSPTLALAHDPDPPGRVNLKGREDWRVRIGGYRVVYGIDDEQRVVEILTLPTARRYTDDRRNATPSGNA